MGLLRRWNLEGRMVRHEQALQTKPAAHQCGKRRDVRIISQESDSFRLIDDARPGQTLCESII
jgi:hypothetical protein